MGLWGNGLQEQHCLLVVNLHIEGYIVGPGGGGEEKLREREAASIRLWKFADFAGLSFNLFFGGDVEREMEREGMKVGKIVNLTSLRVY